MLVSSTLGLVQSFARSPTALQSGQVLSRECLDRGHLGIGQTAKQLKYSTCINSNHKYQGKGGGGSAYDFIDEVAI